MDIVDRLRALGRPSISGNDSITWQAADEIERLREIGITLLHSLEDENPKAWEKTIRHAKRILNVE